MWLKWWSQPGGREGDTEYIFYCKRAILFLSSSKILTPHPPLRPASVYTVRKKDLILRSIERRPQMQFSMVRKFPLWRLRRYSIKYSKVRNFTFNAPCRRKLNNTCWERTNILWICSPPLYHCATLSWEIEEFFQFLCFFFAKFNRLRNIPRQWIQNSRNCVTSYAA